MESFLRWTTSAEARRLYKSSYPEIHNRQSGKQQITLPEDLMHIPHRRYKIELPNDLKICLLLNTALYAATVEESFRVKSNRTS